MAKGVKGQTMMEIRIKMIIPAILFLVICLTGMRSFAAEQEKKSGWIVENNKTYYLDKNGNKLTGLQKIDGRYYYFSKKGVRKTGWRKIRGTKYYFDPENNGARAKGFTKIGNR